MNRKLKFEDSHFVPIVGDGGISVADTADGRVIPVLILNCERHKELLNLIYLHNTVPVGDVNCTWGSNKKYTFLLFDFSRPAHVEVGVKFDLESQFMLADGIVQSRGVYLQSSTMGENVVLGLDEPKILVEVSPKTKLDDWDKKLLTALTKCMKREGMRRGLARETAKQALNRTREIWGIRRGDI